MIPILDLGLIKSGADHQTADPAEIWPLDDPKVQEAAKELKEAFTTIGFVYLANHGLSRETIDKVTNTMETFFTMSNEQKALYKRAGDEDHGWVQLGTEWLNPERPGDYKEAYNIVPDNAQVWPDESVPGFQETLMEYYDCCVGIARLLLWLMGIALELEDPAYFLKRHNIKDRPSFTTLRCLYYPPIPDDIELKPGTVRCGEHSDYGSFTLLYQDNTGGLELLNKDGVYVPAPPVENAFVVNVGDILQRWTADKFVSTKHRVLLPEDETMKRSTRRSIAFFFHPDNGVMIDCIDNSGKYPPVTSEDYTVYRFSVTL